MTDVLCRFILTWSLLLPLCAWAQAPVPAAGPTDAQVERLLQTYVDTWLSPDRAGRMAKLERIWAAGGLHESPYARSLGIRAIHDEIDGFQKLFPNARVILGQPTRTGKAFLCTFELRSPDGRVLSRGHDYVELDDSGKLAKVIGFVLKPDA